MKIDVPEDDIRTHGKGALAAALAKAQGEMHHAKEDAHNPHFKSSYATLASVWNACRQALAKNSLAVAQVPSADGAQVSVTTTLMHSGGEEITGTLTLTARDASPQSVGSAISYARRYGLAAMVGVAPDDDDGEEAQPPRAQVPAAAPVGYSPQKRAAAPVGYNPQNRVSQDWLITQLKKLKVEESRWDDIGNALKGRPSTDLPSVIHLILKT